MSQTEVLDLNDIKRRILGSWELPSNDNYAETITLYGASSKFAYTCSATSAKERIRQIFVGDEIYGNWHIRSATEIRNNLPKSESTLPLIYHILINQSQNISLEFQAILLMLLIEHSKSSLDTTLRNQISSFTSWLAPRIQTVSTVSINNTVKFNNDTGLFLILNFTELNKSILNLNISGLPIDIANWLNNIREIADNDYLKIVSLTDKDNCLTLKSKRGVQVWHRFQESIGVQ